jgi:hypothetical protein
MHSPRTSLGPDFATSRGESCARGTILMAFHAAAEEIWGDAGVRAIGSLLSEEIRRETVDVSAVNLAWVPETYVLAWYEALWHGPCEQSSEMFVMFLDRMMDRGFGRVRKAFLGLAKPAMILNKAPGLWRHDHTHGVLTLERLEKDSAKVKLADHAYTTTSLACLATAEIYRYCVELCQSKNVTEIHYREPDGGLIVRLKWQV